MYYGSLKEHLHDPKGRNNNGGSIGNIELSAVR
jgi:hypothetical protein